ncbi:hypothetical protein C8A00DRAFT_36395 [Chaetomidium leptoderma]|uniref:Uncharacterized protein n=1 Tax=Chaetomidium leptoderma TaxID=669021 RepID=A0AAN6VGB5_9PEZI|nr:hypothetical protein C8A00DRAFT_36395 [Chaetomidium leptoderma]
MSSRLAAPISKLTRCFSTTPAVARPSHLLNNASKVATGAGRKTAPKPMAEEPTSDRHHSTTTTSRHRPTAPSTHKLATIPFMQTFHHSAPKPSPPSFSTIDHAILPNLHAEGFQYDPYVHIRVPLLPDNTLPPPITFHLPEAADAPLRQPEILVVAANPEHVLPAALTEVEGMGVDGVELGFAHILGREEEMGGGGEGVESFEMGRGMIRDLWKGMVDDVFGAGNPSTTGKGGPAAAA